MFANSNLPDNVELSFVNDLLIKIRRDFHKIPELANEEFKTSNDIDDKVLEAVDCIFALIGFITKNGYEVEHIVKQKLSQVLLREYKDEFHHIEEDKNA